MNSNIPVIQGPIPTQGSVIEFAGRKYFTNAADASGSTSGAGSSSDYSSSDTEKRRVALSAANGNRKKQKTSPPRTPRIDNKEIADAFAFLDCHPEEEEEEGGESGVDPFPSQPPPSRRKRKAVTQQPEVQRGEGEEVEEVRIEHRDLDWNDENSIEEDDKERAGHFKPVISPFRRTIEAMLRPGEDPHDPRCWGCDNQEDGDYAVVEKEWKTLMNMFEKRLHRMHPAHLGVFMYRYFAERTAVKMTQTGKMNANGKLVHKGKTDQGRTVYQFDFSVWSAFSMFRHFTEHHLNPHTHITMDLWKLLFAKIQLEADGFYRRHDLTGRIVVDKDAVQTFKLLNQQIYQLYRMKPEQMLFTNPNSAIDTQGYSYLNQERQIIHSHGGTDLFRMNYDTTN